MTHLTDPEAHAGSGAVDGAAQGRDIDQERHTDAPGVPPSLRELEQAATPGPWSPFVRSDTVAVFSSGRTRFGSKEVIGWSGFDSSDYRDDAAANAALIAAMRNALPALLAVCEAAERHVREVESGSVERHWPVLREALDALREVAP